MNYIITNDKFNSGLFEEFKTFKADDLNLTSEKDLSESDIKFSREDILYVASESSHRIVVPRIQDEHKRVALSAMKDKYEFRKILQEAYPDFFFAKSNIDEIEKLDLDRSKSYVLKPVQGFFAIGIEFINPDTDLEEVKKSYKSKIDESKEYFLDGVFTADEVMIEQKINGIEVACDMYFDSNGNPQILNISEHPQHKQFEYMHTLYYFDYDVYLKYYQKLIDFFDLIAKTTNIRNVPFHAEFFVDNEEIFPVEMNALRYGGFGYADTTSIFFDCNPIRSLFQSKQIEKGALWKQREDNKFAWVLAYNGSNLDKNKQKPDKDGFLKKFEEVVHFHELDYTQYPAFGIAYVKSTKDKLYELLELDFDEFNVSM